MYIIMSGGPDEHPFSKYFETYEETEQLLIRNGFDVYELEFPKGEKNYYNDNWSRDFEIEGEEVGYQAYITKLYKYNE